MDNIQEAIKLIVQAGDLCSVEMSTDERIKVYSLIKVSVALLETEPEPSNSCEYCRACRMVRPSGEWQFNCECGDPEKRPVKPESTKFTATDKDIQSCISAWDGDITEQQARYLLEISFQKDIIDRLTAEKFCPECGGKMSLWCEKDVKERMDVKNKELQAAIKTQDEGIGRLKEFVKEIKVTGLMEYGSTKYSIVKLKEICNIVNYL